MSDLIELMETGFFQVGLRLGILALGLGWVAFFALRRRRPLPIAGILIAGATLWTLAILEEPIGTEAIAIGLLVLGPLSARLLRAPASMVPVTAIPGALWLALFSDVTELVWVRVAMALLIPIGGYLLVDFERRYERIGLGVVFFVLAALGVFVAVPDTEWARTLVAVAFPVTFLAWPRVGVSMGSEGAYAILGVFVMVTAQGGGPRPASIVGGLACLGLLLIEPLALALRPGLVRLTAWVKPNWAGAVLASLPQFVVVALCSRVAARFTQEIPALVVVAVVYAGTIAVGISASSSDATEGRQ